MSCAIPAICAGLRFDSMILNYVGLPGQHAHMDTIHIPIWDPYRNNMCLV